MLMACANAYAQEPYWSPDVATIIYEHCSGCHHDGGIGPFPLMSYADAVAAGTAIPAAITSRHMPPWPANPEYRHFANENVLTQAEIDAIVDWINFSVPFGDPGLEPEPPQFLPGGSTLDQIDHVVAIEPYTLQYSTDEYRWFAITNPFPQTIYINKMEVVPGLEAVVHHCDISYDNTGASMAFDQQTPLPGFNSSTGSPTYSYYMNAWQPGGDVVEYPPNWGIAVPPGSDFVLEIHYGPGAQGQVDSTLINLQFTTATSGIRPVSVGWLLGQGAPTLVDGPFVLPANTVRTFHQEYVVPGTRSFLAICPHMHLLGKSYKVWYETPQGDSIPLIDIPQWDFHWQRYYYFQTVQVIPAGSRIKSEGVYDNTIANPYNPNSPPENVYLGATTTDEMFLTYFIWTNYQPGDENIIIDDDLIAGLGAEATPDSILRVHPNPTSGRIIAWTDHGGPIERWILRDAVGRMARNGNGPRQTGERLIIPSEGLRSGAYLLEVWLPTGRCAARVILE